MKMVKQRQAVLDHKLFGGLVHVAGMFRVAAFSDGLAGGDIPHIAVGQPDDEGPSETGCAP